MLKVNFILFVGWSLIAFLVLRFRVRLYIEYRPRHNRRQKACDGAAQRHSRFIASKAGRVAPVDSGEASGVARDLESALINLGASSKEAKERTAAAIAQGPARDFDTLILRAMQAGPANSPRRTR
jgi:hypothetical protein